VIVHRKVLLFCWLCGEQNLFRDKLHLLQSIVLVKLNFKLEFLLVMLCSQHPLSRFAGLCEIKQNSEYPHGTMYCVRCAVQRSLVRMAILKLQAVR
jgi:hypothetical protein